MKLNLAETFAVITPALDAVPKALSPSLYQELENEFNGFAGHTLVSMHSFNQDWPTWEKHPAGDEIVVLLSGEARFVLRTDVGDEPVTLAEAGSYVIVPRDTWHTARISMPTKMLFITPGEGTVNQESP